MSFIVLHSAVNPRSAEIDEICIDSESIMLCELIEDDHGCYTVLSLKELNGDGESRVKHWVKETPKQIAKTVNAAKAELAAKTQLLVDKKKK